MKEPRRRHAWDPAHLSEGEIASIKGMAANHPVGWSAVLEKICRVNEVSFAIGGVDGQRETDYAEGKRAIGVVLREIAGMTLRHNPRGAEPGAAQAEFEGRAPAAPAGDNQDNSPPAGLPSSA